MRGVRWREVVRGLLSALLLAGASQAWAFDLAELMGKLAAHKSGEATFTEQRFVRDIETPLQSSGMLRFLAPDRLERHTLQPRDESMVVQGNTATVTRSGRSRTIALDSVPEVGGLIEALRGTLSGNAAALQKNFTTSLAGSPSRWALELLPRDERLAAQVQNLRLYGQEGELRSLELDFRNGDRSVTTVQPWRAAAR